ncbi:MAG: 3-isopropylmalate dehydratase small subunit [Bacilli bacterium]
MSKIYKAIILNQDNIDTDIIIPKQFLKITSTKDLGQYAFYEWRYDALQNPKEHILNEKANQGYNVLITAHNFGCGSSREHAAWALADYGFDIIIASSYSDIFYRNWLNNHKLPIILKKDELEWINNQDDLVIDLDLENKVITINNRQFNITLSNKMHQRLLKGIDDIDFTLAYLDKITAFENK